MSEKNNKVATFRETITFILYIAAIFFGLIIASSWFGEYLSIYERIGLILIFFGVYVYLDARYEVSAIRLKDLNPLKTRKLDVSNAEQ